MIRHYRKGGKHHVIDRSARCIALGGPRANRLDEIRKSMNE